MESIRKKTVSGLYWNLIERLFSKCLQFVFSVLIARLLLPSDYGVIAIANVVITLSDILVDSGFSKALINKLNRTDDDYNTVFCFSLFTASFLYILIFCISPSIERFYAIKSLSTVIRIQTLVLILNALGAVQYLHLVTAMDFRKKAWIELPTGLISGAVGLYLAFHGAGVWALVVQTLGAGFIRLIGMWIVVRWIPRFRFSVKIAKEFFSFGVKVLISDYIGRMYASLFSLIIGKRFSSNSLGLYGKAIAFSDVSFSFISGPIAQVTYPAISKIQNDRGIMERNFYEMFGMLSYVAFPIMFGLIAMADPLVTVVLSDNWNGMIPMLRIFSVSAFLGTISSIPGNYLYVMGYSGISLNIKVISCVLGLILFFIFCNISILWVCVGVTMVGAVGLFLQLCFLRKVLGISFSGCARTILPSFILAAVMASFLLLGNVLIDNLTLRFVSGILFGIIFYIGLSALLRMSYYQKTINLVLSVLKK